MEGVADHVIEEEQRRKTKEKIEEWRRQRLETENQKKVCTKRRFHMTSSCRCYMSLERDGGEESD